MHILCREIICMQYYITRSFKSFLSIRGSKSRDGATAEVFPTSVFPLLFRFNESKSVASREIRNMPMRRYAHEICNGPSRNASGNGWNSWSCSDHPSGSAGHAGRVFRNESNAVLPRLDYVYERIARARL